MTTTPAQTSGFIDAHSHLRSTSLIDQGVAGSSRLEEAILRMTAMSAVDPADDSFVAASDLVLAGVTGVQVIFHTFANREQYLEALSATATGVEKSGIRALVILGITDQAEFLPEKLADRSLLPEWLPPAANLSVSDLDWVYREAVQKFPSIQFGIGPVGAQWCSDMTLAALGELAQEGIRVHTHMLESNWQRNWLAENPLLRLDRHGLLGPKTSLAHGVWCNQAELALIADRGAQLVTCPGSNALLRSGMAPVDVWRESGVRFGFGLDSAADPITPWQIASDAIGERALQVLTSGGVACTDLDTTSDEVVWTDLAAGSCERVTIRGVNLVESGRLRNESEVAAARDRVHRQLMVDSPERNRRQQRLSDLMPRYLSELEKCCG
jgi:cytosine/adenosine deaminase-related metal-dependent hydrolase